MTVATAWKPEPILKVIWIFPAMINRLMKTVGYLLYKIKEITTIIMYFSMHFKWKHLWSWIGDAQFVALRVLLLSGR